MRLFLSLAAATGLALGIAAGASSAPPGHMSCVGAQPGCFSTLQAALGAAHNGDTIRIEPGNFAGGLTIDKSVKLEGAGANATTIGGGGPVLTIGVFHAATEPTVAIQGVTITGGVTTSSFGTDGSRAAGGGIQIPPNSTCTGGATVTISNSVITGNIASPSNAGTDVGPCPTSSVEHSLASGGGIYNGGSLTLRNTTVSHNVAGGPISSNAWGGGILSNPQGSTLTIDHSVITDNEAVAVDPNGVQATGGGMLVQTGAFTMTDSWVTNNTASLTSARSDLPNTFQANSAGIQFDRSATILGSHIDDNLAMVQDPNGEPVAYDSAMCCGGSGSNDTLVLKNSSVSNNRVVAAVADTTDTGPDGGALEFDVPATVEHVTVTGNVVDVSTSTGLASAIGAVSAFDGDSTAPAVIADSLIGDNSVTTTSASGPATLQGGGIANNGSLVLRHDRVTGNTGNAQGVASGSLAQGGGIWNGDVLGGSPQLLALDGTNVEGNVLAAAPGIPIAGGGVYTVGFPITLAQSKIDHNAPDDCSGC